MKKIFLILIFIFSLCNKRVTNISNDPSVIKSLDTIYILFEEGNNQYINKYSLAKNNPDRERTAYFFKLNKKDYIEFYHEKYLDWDAFEARDSSKILIKKKKFLKQNKIIDYSYFEKNGLIQSILSFHGTKKKFFIIDKGEFKKGEIKLNQVYFTSNCEFGDM